MNCRMKKTILIGTVIFTSVFTACYNGPEDHKNDKEPYPTYDTTSQMENVNSTGTNLDSVRLKEIK
jgi:hypothetical protein